MASRPTGSSHATMTMGALLPVGGIMGYAKAKSAASLVAGLSFGAVYMASAYTINNGDPFSGHAAAATASLVLTGAMGARALKAGAVGVPHALAALGLASTLYEARKANEWKD